MKDHNSRWSRIAYNAILALTAITVGLVLAEAGLRIAGYVRGSMYVYDSRRGWALHPGAEGWVSTESGMVYIRINSDGMRDREHHKEKPAGTYRIAILGDSFCEAFQVQQEKTFWALLEKDLPQYPMFSRRSVEVLNFGVGAYGTAQELLTLRDKVWKYSPDLVLLAFCTENDVFNNVREFNPTRPEDAAYYVRDGDKLAYVSPVGAMSGWGRVFLDLGHRIADLSTRLRLIQLLNEAARERAQNRVQERIARQMAAIGIDLPPSAPYVKPRHAMLVDAWRLTEDLISEIARETKSHGAEFLLVTLSNGVQVHPYLNVRNEVMAACGLDSLLYPDLRIRDFAERSGIPVLTLAIPMAEYALKTRTFLHGFPASSYGIGHWNEEGHRFAAQIITSRMTAATPITAR